MSDYNCALIKYRPIKDGKIADNKEVVSICYGELERVRNSVIAICKKNYCVELRINNNFALIDNFINPILAKQTKIKFPNIFGTWQVDLPLFGLITFGEENNQPFSANDISNLQPKVF